MPRMHVALIFRTLGPTIFVWCCLICQDSNIPCRLPRVDFDQCQDDCIHWQFDESTENHHVDICSLLWGFRLRVPWPNWKNRHGLPTKYGGRQSPGRFQNPPARSMLSGFAKLHQLHLQASMRRGCRWFMFNKKKHSQPCDTKFPVETNQ